MAWDSEPVIITIAPVGAEVTRDNHPSVPYTPAEIAAASLDAVAAGASVVHLHAREPDGKPSGDPKLFAEAIALIRAKANPIIMVSTGGAVWMTIEQRTLSLEANPDMCSLETGSMNFGDDLFLTSRPDSISSAKLAYQKSIVPEIELFDVGHAVAASRMLGEGHLKGPLNVNLVLGVPGGIDAVPEAIPHLLRPLPGDVRWAVTAVGRHQRRMLAVAMLLGAYGVRVGFEDNVYLRKGQLAKSNAELVEDIAALARQLGRQVATPQQARSILQVK
ncbi:3-keto-5-aminohexanoate cleavage protein [Aestuariivirga litoralis]|uniref:3-keto-5-aminohexanoate cleavage protein n=1 Tax=Aestuariivirga litoralis TaxID=2650924 RepID=UPI0018C5CE27|nr:3-keto-5-aminohexanoate cleavage protein [Aestuariivirga litoralis]MBG1232317.1 3-keto-5-aminohexanoate cleavage protein [Aestuariivirga litoralis]